MAYPHITDAEIRNWFTYHPPDAEQTLKYEQLRKAGLELACTINALVPDSQEKWQAIFQLRDVIMWANAGVACNPPMMPERWLDERTMPER